ncbi:MarC family protein [Pleurocapsa sp. PCC 7319]|uniref:MarC family protein n=1 Tax=Pleurocapsa sp. PCC 7319 TaxID=118161 RepID=UPI0003454883|nr:MarC family protein [Pleurocapsa sp. PCC 7319]
MKTKGKEQKSILSKYLWWSIKPVAVILPLMLMLMLNLGLPGTLPTSSALSTNSDCAVRSLATDCTFPLLAQTNPIAESSSSAPENVGNLEEDNLKKWGEFRGILSAINIFILFFVTLGPFKIIPTFIRLTQNADETLRRNLAIRSAGLASLVIFLVVILGGNILAKWTIGIESLMIASGILLFLASLQQIKSQYETSGKEAPPPEPSMKLLVNPLTFPTILTPYGIALALLLMVANTRISQRPWLVLVMLLLVMFLNLVAMLAARPILKTLKPMTLQVLGLVLGVMQLALGIEMILSGIGLAALILQDLLN